MRAQIKHAYFRLSKRFHPDRYFRRNIGDHAGRLDRIFKHLVEAYELLSDPTTRAEIERSLAAPPPEPAPESSAPPASGGYRAPSRMENLARLRRSFGSHTEKILAERRFRASTFYEAAQAAAQAQKWTEASANVRLAIAFDPFRREYKQAFASIQAEVQAQRALALLEDRGGIEPAEALEALEEVICFRPADVDLQVRAAELALAAGEFERASEYADQACELEPESAAHHLLRARVQRRAGNRNAAAEAAKKAARLAPEDPHVKAELKRLGRK